MITPTLIGRLAWKTYIIFMCTNFAFVPLVYFFYPETANLTLEEIDHLYMEPGIAARKVAARMRKARKQGLDPLEEEGFSHVVDRNEKMNSSTPPEMMVRGKEGL